MAAAELPPHIRDAADGLGLGELTVPPVVRRRMGRAVAVAVLGLVLAVAPLVAGFRGWQLVLAAAVLTLPGLILLGGAGWGVASLLRFGSVTVYPFEGGLIVGRPNTTDDQSAARWEDIRLAPPNPRHPDDVRLQMGTGRPRTMPPALYSVLAARLPDFDEPESAGEPPASGT